MSVTCRTFVKGSLATAAIGVPGSAGRAYGANEKVVVGLIGCGGRGLWACRACG